jgi:hypothetical protein
MSKKKKDKKKKDNAKQQLESLKTRYGTDINWVDIKLPMTSHEVESYFGPECKEYDHLCICCNAWKEFHTNRQIVTVSLERDSIIKLLNE